MRPRSSVKEDLRGQRREFRFNAIVQSDDRRGTLRIDMARAADSTAEGALRTSVGVRWKGVTIPVSAPEHTVVMKLKFRSSQDLEDAAGILAGQWDQLDFAGMRAFAENQRVETSLERLIRR